MDWNIFFTPWDDSLQEREGNDFLVSLLLSCISVCAFSNSMEGYSLIGPIERLCSKKEKKSVIYNGFVHSTGLILSAQNIQDRWTTLVLDKSAACVWEPWATFSPMTPCWSVNVAHLSTVLYALECHPRSMNRWSHLETFLTGTVSFVLFVHTEDFHFFFFLFVLFVLLPASCDPLSHRYTCLQSLSKLNRSVFTVNTHSR